MLALSAMYLYTVTLLLVVAYVFVLQLTWACVACSSPHMLLRQCEQAFSGLSMMLVQGFDLETYLQCDKILDGSLNSQVCLCPNSPSQTQNCISSFS